MLQYNSLSSSAENTLWLTCKWFKLVSSADVEHLIPKSSPRWFGQTNKQSDFEVEGRVLHLLTLKGSKRSFMIGGKYMFPAGKEGWGAWSEQMWKLSVFKVCGKKPNKNEKETMFTLDLHPPRWMRAARSARRHTGGTSLSTTLRNSLQPPGFFRGSRCLNEDCN